ncbi:hypothetical protein BJY16_003729 [Actinoplanes octamycinicus]|uniref:DNA-binding protein n=1 Tax=Actinoplanes octamycinicus TaxID=135948 RepID=A0A7W7GXQ5_9ACTN|nr:hypothetical protein [Actinoplanes octamycinicus]MBB4740270.1 hypothetical protein [Actinoplanes octamycinicus]GIE63484.1 hypothetical protein Aoc01nite_88860 [Actinoplanes octamycinicus]
MSEALLEAGAILPGTPADAGLDMMTARAYRHPVLDGRTVVRVTGATVGPAEDLSMEFLGFDAAGAVPVGHGRRSALGFPAWALVHDPAHGRHALALVKDMERLARTARHKPGRAREGYAALAGRLEAAAPRLLPTFWEQAGRAFLAAGNQRMAGTCFSDARRAEQVHGLAVDEDRVRDVHLEFALAGGLTAAMLTAYARGVAERRPPAEAFELVRSLTLRRVAGGSAPHAGMVTELARLARAAGRTADRETDEVVARLLGYPAMARSHPAVWKSLRTSLIRLGRRDATVRARLLEIMPDPPGWQTDIRDQWLELLEATGAAADLAAPDAPARRWLERFLDLRRFAVRDSRRNARLLALVERLAPRLVTEGEVVLATHPSTADLDVLDLCLATGVPADIGADGYQHGLEVTAWVDDTGAGRRDLAAIAADPRLRPLLRRGVRSALGRFPDNGSLTSPPFGDAVIGQVFGAAGIRAVLIELIHDLVGRAGAGAVAGLSRSLTGLAPLWSPAGMALAPDAFRALLEVDVPAVLARTLRAGLLAELTWPAYERAASRLSRIDVGLAWPELVLHDDRAAQVISPEGSVTEHVFRFPAAGQRHAPRRSWNQLGCLYVDGDLLVYWHGDGVQAGYWSSRPDRLIEGEWQLHPAHGFWSPPLPVPGGGLTTGQQTVHAGDTRVLSADGWHLAGDGRAYWRHEPADPNAGVLHRTWRWRQFDPRTGRAGPPGLPAFFAEAGDALIPGDSWLRPVPAEFAGSPLGVRDGLAGWRAIRTADGSEAGMGVDGRAAVLSGSPDLPYPGTLAGALSLPAAEAPLLITRAGRHLRIWTSDGEHLLEEHHLPAATLPPLDWWHALRARDEAGSAALRGLDETTAAALLAVDDAVADPDALRAAVAATVRTHLPAVTDTVLADRIADVAAHAVRLRRRIAEIATRTRRSSR